MRSGAGACGSKTRVRGLAVSEVRTSAVVTLAAYRSWTKGETVPGDWQAWAERLAVALGQVLADVPVTRP
jgi:hypothetical protein